MSVNVTVNGPLVAIKSKPGVTTATKIYTAAANNPWVIGFRATNTSGGPVTVTAELVSDSVGYAFMDESVPADSSIEGAGFPLPMRDGDSIRVTISSANVVAILMTVMDRAGALN